MAFLDDGPELWRKFLLRAFRAHKFGQFLEVAIELALADVVYLFAEFAALVAVVVWVARTSTGRTGSILWTSVFPVKFASTRLS